MPGSLGPGPAIFVKNTFLETWGDLVRAYGLKFSGLGVQGLGFGLYIDLRRFG